MIVLKLIVLSVYVAYVFCFNNYCEICRNHTLCLFIEAGPNITCKAYNKTALLTKKEINEIVDKINEKRNYIAMGFSNILPQAANMKKIYWSSELATFAQRWVDQCDQSLQPDKEDQCRDLFHIKVGQNIATIQGQSPGLQVKSFVEMWYMQILKYQGIVTYYNESQHSNTDYFTQLIWAETDSVGCGKARFYVESKLTIVERLVCNFAPKGNINGKPVYTIGYPGTQCSNDMIPDVKYTGLCVKVHNSTARKCTTQQSHVSSLLRILNLSNSSVKQDIDPIRSNLKQINNTNYKSNDQRNQKIRHVYFNHTHGDMKRVSPLRAQNFWNPSMNNNLSYLNRNQQERGHSRLYHGYEAHIHDHDAQSEMNGQNIRRYDITTDSINSHSDSDYRKYGYKNNQCTRRMQPPRNNYDAHECNTPICTRGQKCDNSHQLTTVCHLNACVQDPCPPSRCKPVNECPCNKQTTCFTTPTTCTCNVNCKCLNMGITPSYPDFLRMKDEVNLDETRKSQSQLPEYKLYDLPAPIVVKSGNEKLRNKNSSPRSQSIYKSVKKINSRREYDEYHGQVKKSKPSLKLHAQDRDYLYETFDSSKRKRRDLEEHITFRPFWEIDKFDYKKPSELKSIRYTTLGIRKHRKSKATTATLTPKPNVVTESITISLKNNPSTRYLKSHVSEKYLSFDELMRLRKFTTEEIYQNPRRKVNDESILREGSDTSSSSTTEITTNTPFVRKKHCTRKLTCTWTAWTMSGGDMLVQGGNGGGINRGSRTPPGYVEGCTRTSTCTREFMNRNKMSTISDSAASETTPEDEDYCERRALNVQRRNLEEISITNSTVETQNTQDEPITTTTTVNYETTSNSIVLFVPQYGCVCSDKNLRTKRDEFMHIPYKNARNFKEVTRLKRHKNDVPINNMHIFASKNIISSNQRNIKYIKCPCNGATSIELYIYLCTFILLKY